ncbi:MAG: response regulator [Chitinivibrionales bacterium]|nr:response regulator [Chitinivibrionales bacterium]
MKNELIQLLVVDDEKAICTILGQYLQKNNYTVFTAGSGDEALKIIEQNKIDLVLTDIKMPGMSGVELLKWIREHNRSIPVLITTGFPTLDSAIEALKLGAFDYLTKPFHLEEIGEKIKRALSSKRLEEENLLFSKLVSLHEVTKVLASTHQLLELHYKILDFSMKISRSDGGALMLHKESNRPFLTDTSPAPYDRSFWDDGQFYDLNAWVVKNGEPLIMEANPSKTLAGFIRLPAQVQSYIAFPLKTSSRTLGVLNLVRSLGNDSFSNVDLEIITVLASQASISIENVRLYQDIQDNYLKTIHAFALAVEAKDQYTHGHSENVMKYTVVLAKHLGLGQEEIEHAKYAGLLHDIGKIGISESILNKAGRLTPEEFDQIKRHPELGGRIIADVPFLKALVPLVLHHHEFYNGKGYPDGLHGDDIPFSARILSIADAYEAMTSDRPYRHALSPATAFEILKKERGRQFDPQMVDAFLNIMQGKADEK